MRHGTLHCCVAVLLCCCLVVWLSGCLVGLTAFSVTVWQGSHFPGLIPLIYTYLDIIKCEGEARDKIQRYMHMIVQRVRGDLPTAAQWMRTLVRSHPKYKHDSVVSTEIAYDVMNVSEARAMVAAHVWPCCCLIADFGVHNTVIVMLRRCALFRW